MNGMSERKLLPELQKKFPRAQNAHYMRVVKKSVTGKSPANAKITFTGEGLALKDDEPSN
jgi:hypothetical protein